MNNFKSNSKVTAGFIAAAGAILAPSQASAASMVGSTGMSDETLFIILLAGALFQLIAIMVIAGVIKSIAANRELWDNRFGKKAAMVAILFAFGSSQAFAQGADFDALIMMNDTGFMVLVTVNILLFFTFIWMISKLNGILTMLARDEEGNVPETFMDKMRNMLTDAVPVEAEADVEMDHEYDGIRELDNNLPPWWLYGFYFSIIFGVVYIANYHFTGNGDLQLAEYQAEMTAADEAKKEMAATSESSVDENNVELLTDATALADGEKTFKLYCAPCHAEHGGSSPAGVGPNLTDEYWIHGGSVTDIFRTIKYGVPEKGMVSWQAQMNPTQIQKLASFIKSLAGSNPENSKDPQGDIYTEEESAGVVEETTEEELTENTADAPLEEAVDPIEE